MNTMPQPPAYEELDLEGQGYDADDPLAPEPGCARATRSTVVADLFLHYVQVPVNLRAQVWYWFVAIPRAMAWITVFVLLVSTLQILSQQEPRCNANVPCPITETVQLRVPCRFCNVADGVLIVERSNHSILSWPHCSGPVVFQLPQHEMVLYDSIKEFECDLDLGNGSYRFITVSFWIWYLEDRTDYYDPSTYNARILHALAFSCSDNATTSPSTLEVQIDRRVYQKEQPWLSSENLVWNRLFIASKPAHGFAVLP